MEEKREEKREEGKLGLTGEDVRQGAPNPAGLFQAMGNAECDAEAIAASEDGRLIQENMKVMTWGEDSEEEKSFWAGYEKGLKKELHGDPENVHSKWASYLPLAAVALMEEKGKAGAEEFERKFPLIFCLHGAHNPIQLTESYGVMQVAAREECIVIAPENENLEHILELLDYAKEHYPVDESRVYSIGYSFGGFMTSRNVLARPDIFAGAGMGGMLFAGDVCEHELDGQYYPAYQLTEEMLARAEELEVPALLFMGENEMLNLEPLWKDPQMTGREGEPRDGVIPLDAKDKYNALNNWRRVAGAKPCTAQGQEFYEKHVDPVVKSIGAEFERTEVREYHGRKYFIGDSLNEQGECLFRTVSCEGMAHWPTTSYAELVWEQIGRFARDTKTGKLIRL